MYLLGCKHGEVHTPLSCIGLSKSDSNLYTNFEFYEENNHKHLKDTLIYNAKQFVLEFFFSRQVYIF